jgi:ABC-2 type transport system ATP-binding protein
MMMIETRGLRKAFGNHVVLDGIDLNVAEGTIYALLGPNGAGKTTMVHILSTLIKADGGKVRVAGHDVVREPDAVRAAIGVTWCAVLILVGYLWARAVYNCDPVK